MSDVKQQGTEAGPAIDKPRLANEKLLMVDDDQRVAERGPGMVRLSPEGNCVVYVCREAAKVPDGNGEGPPYDLVDRLRGDVGGAKSRLDPMHPLT